MAGLIGLCGLIVVGETRKILLAAILLDNPLQMDVSWGYDIKAGGRGAIAGFNVPVTTIALLILYAAWFGERALTGRSPWKPTLGGNLAPALYLLFAGLSIFVAYDKTIAFYECWLFLQMFLLYVYLVSSVNTRQEVLFILSFLFVAVGIEALLMMAVFITGRNFEFYLLSTLADASFMAEGNVRPGGTIGSPNSAAGYLSVLLVSAFSLMLVHRPPFIKWLAVGAFGLGLGALLLTQSRGGWLAFGLGVSLVGSLAWARGWLSIRVSLICVLIGLGGGLWFSETILERLFGDDGGSTSFRWKLLSIAYRVIADHPLLGVGVEGSPRIPPKKRLKTRG